MSRPKTKDELLSLSQENYNKLLDLLDGYSEDEVIKDFPPGTMNKNIRDVLAHLHERHCMMLKRYIDGMKGKKPEMPAPGYTWKTTTELNKVIWEKRKDIDYTEVKKLLDESYNNIQKIINSHSEEELFTKKKYHWTGSTSLGSYLISATSSHYDWAYKLIKKLQA